MKSIFVFVLASTISQFCLAQNAQLEQLKQTSIIESNNAAAWFKLAMETDFYAQQLVTSGHTNEAILYASEAQDFFQLALSIDPYNAQNWKQAGLHYFRKDDAQRKSASAAIAYLQRAESLAPNDSEVLAALITAYENLGLQTTAEQFEQRLKDAKKGAIQSPFHKF